MRTISKTEIALDDLAVEAEQDFEWLNDSTTDTIAADSQEHIQKVIALSKMKTG